MLSGRFRLNHSNTSIKCDCATETEFQGNAVKEKVDRDLIKIHSGPNFGDRLYRCRTCDQLWEENLSRATYHDWTPILVKISQEEAEKKYGPAAQR